MSRRYPSGCLYREKRKAGPDVWVFRYRDGEHNRKEKIGTVEQFPNRKAAMKACEVLRAKINRESKSPRVVAELLLAECGNGRPYPASALRAGIGKSVGWQTVRDTVGTMVNSEGADVATHASTDAPREREYHDGQVRSSCDTREAKGTVTHRDNASVPKRSHAVDGIICNCLNVKRWALNSAVECHL